MAIKKNDSPPARLTPRQWGLVALTLVLGIGLSLGGFLLARQLEHDKSLDSLRTKAAEHHNLLRRELAGAIQAVQAIGAFFDASKEVTRQEFSIFAKDLLATRTGIQALEWLPRVRHSQREEYERAAQRAGFPGFQITERNAQGRLQKSGQRSEYFPIYFVEPLKGNEPALGFDPGSNPVRLRALNKARDAGKMVATEGVRLVQEPGEQFGLVVFQPVYREGAPLTTVEERRGHLRGFAVGVFRVGDLVEAALAGTPPAGINTSVYDLGAGQKPSLLYFHRSRALKDPPSEAKPEPPTEAGHRVADTVHVADRQWEILCEATPGFEAKRRTLLPWGVLGGGLLATLLLALSVFSIARRGASLEWTNQQLEKDIAERKQAEEARDRFYRQRQLALDAARMGWWHYDPVSRVSSWDKRYAEIFEVEGYQGPNEEILKRLHPDDLPRVWAAVEAALNPDDPKQYSAEYRVNLPDGSVRWVEAHGMAVFEGEGGVRRAVSFSGTVADITERKKAEASLRESEQKLRLFIGHAPAALAMFDREMRYMAVSTQWMADYHLGEQDIIGRSHYEVFPEIPDRWKAVHLRGLNGEVIEAAEDQFERADGRIQWLQWAVRPWRRADDTVGGIVIFSVDITERKETSAALRSSENKYSTVFRHTPAAVILTSLADGRIVEVNDRVLESLGYDPGEMIGRTTTELKIWADAAERERYFELLRQHGRATNLEAGFRTKSGEIRKGLVSGEILQLEDGPHVLGVTLDITEHKKTEEALRQSEELFRHAFDNANTGMCLVNTQGRLTKVNDRLCQFFGYSRQELEGMTVGDISHPDDRDLSPSFIKRSLDGETESAVFEKRYFHKDGHFVWGQVSSSLVRDAEGRPLYFVSHVTDITDRKLAEQALQEREALLNEVGRIAKIGGWEMDLITRQARWTQGTYDIVEIEPGQPVPGLDEHVSYYLPEYQPVVQEAMRALIQDDRPLDFEAQARTAKGRLIWVRAVGRAVRQDGACVKVFGTLQDITARKKTEEELRQSETHFRYLFENMLNGFAYCQMLYEDGQPQDFVYLQVNSNFAKLTGLGDVVGKRVSEVIPGIRQDNPELFDIFGRVALSGQPEWFETYLPALDMWFSISAYSPRREYFVAVFEVITERKKAEERLKASEERFRELYENMSNGVAVYRAVDGGGDFVIEGMNKAGCRVGQAEEKDILGRRVTEVFPKVEEMGLLAVLRRVWTTGQPEQHPVSMYKDQRLQFWAENYVYKLSTGEVVAIFEDVTQKRMAEDALRFSSKQWESTFNAMTDGVCILGPDFKIRQSNEAMTRLFGKSRQEMIGSECYKLIHGAPEPIQGCPFLRMQKTMSREQEVVQFNDRWLEITVDPILDATGALQGAVHVVSDITERKQAEEALQKSQVRYQALFENISDKIYTHDLEGRLTSANPAAVSFLGYSLQELLALKVPDLMPEKHRQDFYEKYLKQIREQGHAEGVMQMVSREGAIRYLEYRNQIIHPEDGDLYVSGVGRDITERLRAEEERNNLESQLRQAQKMEALGTLAGGIAHDFNNILAAIMGYSELALDNTTAESENLGYLAQVLAATARAQRLVRQILTFSRKTEVQTRPLDLNKHVTEAVELIKQTIPRMVKIELHLSQDLKPINGDPGQLEQVLMNLATNANDAMPGGGRLIIETEDVTLDEEYCQAHLEAEPGDYVRLQVSDTGQGMTKEVMNQIFDPFFTTKETGKGTGLGLATVFGIVKNHGGFINCYSEPGQGTIFRIYFPALEQLDVPKAPKESAADEAPGGRETILLVDDEEMLRDLGGQMLSRAGYEVVTAGNGEEALEVFQQKKEAIDLVILDMSMPGMGGHKCLVEMLKLDPQAKILVASGYSRSGQLKDTMAAGAAEYIAKPFQRVKILKTIRGVLDKGKEK